MIDRLSRLEIFSGYEKTELEILGKFFKVKKFNSGEPVIKPGETGKELFIILTGVIHSTLILPGSIDRKHNEYKRGDVFGELPVFGHKPDFNSYNASEGGELLVIEENDFIKLIEEYPVTSIKLISRLLSHTIMQLRKSSRFLADVVEWGENASRRVITDELTGLYNRAFLDDALENFFYISQSNNKPLSFLMLDTDNFRKINELIGHEAGNSVIIEFAGIIRRIISKHGIMARYGGDEFSILLPETNLNTAVEIAEQIRESVENFDFSKHLGGHDIVITTSIGISSYPDTAADLVSFKQKADDSLYKAKVSGKNCIRCIE
ncbi:MAG TPA: GGDEF domain-containing protein [Spirochaetota bacterium]|nr:GGDEF domain-containing protein [Spirochaetota bacterium]